MAGRGVEIHFMGKDAMCESNDVSTTDLFTIRAETAGLVPGPMPGLMNKSGCPIKSE
jgi:hypothetical protein